MQSLGSTFSRRGALPLAVGLVAARLRPIAGSTWFLGALVALATWTLTFALPAPGLDLSWVEGLYLAAQRGFHFGTELIWTFGPLGFLSQPLLVGGSHPVAAFVYQSALHFAFCMSLVWALRRTFNAAIAVCGTFLAVAGLPLIDVPLVIAVVWALAALDPETEPQATPVLIFGIGLLGGIECLVKLSSGPTILLICVVSLLALPTRWRELTALAVVATVTFLGLWFATGQALGNLPDYFRAGAQMVSGYSSGLALEALPSWYVPLAAALSLALVAWGAIAAPPRRRAFAGVVMAIASFAIFKEGVVRMDQGHMYGFFATAAALTLTVRWSRAALPAAAATLALAIGFAVHTLPVGLGAQFNPIANVDRFSDQVGLAASPSQRDGLISGTVFSMRSSYAIDHATLAKLRGRSVAIEPWEVGVAWAYGLNWRPLPDFQDEQVYTSWLDRNNAVALASRSGPDRVLREAFTTYIDDRNALWDPPAERVAMLCHYVAVQTTAQWQVLARAPDRCGPSRRLASVGTSYGRTIQVPPAPHGTAEIARIQGAGVSGLERLQAFAFRANIRHVTVNRAQTYRLVPGTAADGLLMSVPRRADFPGAAFALSTGVRTLKVTGGSGDLTIEFDAIPIQPRGAARRAS